MDIRESCTRFRAVAVTCGLAGVMVCASGLIQTAAAQDAPTAQPSGDRMGPDGMGRGAGGDRMMSHMQRALNLTPDQVTQIKAMQEDTRQQQMALHKSEQAKVRGVLTDDQKVKFDKMQEKMMERGGRRGRGGPPPPPPDGGTTSAPQ